VPIHSGESQRQTETLAGCWVGSRWMPMPPVTEFNSVSASGAWSSRFQASVKSRSLVAAALIGVVMIFSIH
jgi:hypothetical protein